ncbi:hypothetical protein [Pedobacter gandavensis]|uniref:Uncharacterized protein n=1 Tax=Pedobacter gandavensis TaxID=2679963 RepID=A0ABR6EXS1_9SPHI|nr:hypothetical protein [Pedobacter gandavensis]MBB2150051.1 hypothetical protein [Pedobacter gandavensis]
MLKRLSYLNIFLAMAYLLLFVTGRNFVLIGGVCIVVIFNAFVIKKIQKKGQFGLVYAGLAICCLCFWAYLTMGCTYIVQSAIEHRYFADVWNYLIPTSLFLLSIILQLFFSLQYFKAHQVTEK